MMIKATSNKPSKKKCKRKPNPSYLIKVYDNVPITKLCYDILTEMNINQNTIRAIRELYRQSKEKIKIGQISSKGFIVHKKLRQGCPISSTLFKIYVKEALKI